MNILALNNFGIKNNPIQNGGNIFTPKFTPQFTPTTKFGLIMAKPLSNDTVSFKATPKTLANRSNGVSLKTAKIINKEAAELQPEIEKFMRKLFKDVSVSDKNPNGIVEIVRGRTKTPESIVEKSATRDWNNKAEIFANMTDLNGIKIILRDGSKKAVKKVLDTLGKAIDNGVLILTEVENKRPIAAQKLKGKEAEKWDYGHSEDVDSFVARACEATEKSIRFELFDYTKVNYPALHLLLRFPGQKRCFETQIVGHDVAIYKDLDDLIFKILGNKNVDPKYKPIVDIIKPLTEEGNEAILNKFNMYRGEVFIFQKEKEPMTNLYQNQEEYFLPLKYNIPRELDMNNLYKIYQKCKGN